MQDDERAREILKVALIDLEYIIADVSKCATCIPPIGNDKVHVALTQLEAVKRELIGIAYGVQNPRLPSLH